MAASTISSENSASDYESAGDDHPVVSAQGNSPSINEKNLNDEAFGQQSEDALNSFISFREQGLAPEPTADLQYPLPDEMLVHDLLRALSCVKGWDTAVTQKDTLDLNNVRIVTVADLRLLPKKSWSSLPVPLVVSELLRRMAWKGLSCKTYEDQLMKTCLNALNSLKLENTNSSSVQVCASTIDRSVPLRDCQLDPSDTPNLIRQLLYDGSDGPSSTKVQAENVLSNPQPIKIDANEKSAQELVQLLLNTNIMDSAEKEDMLRQDSTSQSRNSQPKLGICPNNPNRIRVSASGGQIYEIDRYCPHKQYDLTKAAPLRGSIITCPKHKWDFDLSKGGACVDRPGKTLNCVSLSW